MSLILLAAAAAAIEPVPAKVIPTAPRCPATSGTTADAPQQKPTIDKLGHLPPANAYRTVYRLVDGCEAPVVVRYGIGGGR